MGVGGAADILFKPNDLQELSEYVRDNQHALTTIGVGSNILISDNGIRGVVIRLGRSFASLSYSNHIITAGASVLDYQLATFAMQNNISGFEFFVGIPGTVGGALAMNAGCYGNDTSTLLQSAKIINNEGRLLTLTAEEIGYGYRKHALPNDWIFIEGTFAGTIGKQEEIKDKMNNIMNLRNKTQPIKSKTCGSIFKNPIGYKAWELIENSGCKGLSLGDAKISNLHANFVINKGNATAREIENLCKQVRTQVQLINGIKLEWEIVRLGN